MKKLAFDSLVVGTALFAMFFGAGNIIFPPYIGLVAGPEWVAGFLWYYLADVGLALVAIFAMLRANSIDRVEGIMYRLGDIPAKMMMIAAVICIGPLLAIPRTCATTFSMTVVPLAGTEALWLQVAFSVAYFLAVYVFSIKESSLVDIVGKYLTPLLVLGLLLMIIVGTLNPMGPISDTVTVENVTWTGITFGYQTLDVLATLVFGLIVVNALKSKGYTCPKLKFISVSLASLIAGVLLFVVYGGLCYLGATASTLYPETIDKGQLVMHIAGTLFGTVGSALLGVVVGLACLTTAVALTGAAGTFFNTMTNGRWPYKTIVIFVCAFSTVMANWGLGNIIAFAEPILVFIYPGALVVVFLSLFDNRIENDNIFRFATAGAMAVSFCEVASRWLPETFSFITVLPFQADGFGWVVPAVVFGVVGSFFKAPRGKGPCVSNSS
ncbi:MAG: Branched-chain amino acid transport system 2 carrier protein [Desulfovibrio sp.]